MSKFFAGGSGRQVEVNKRGIMADIELAGSAYEGKKISRAQLLEMDDADSGS